MAVMPEARCGRPVAAREYPQLGGCWRRLISLHWRLERLHRTVASLLPGLGHPADAPRARSAAGCLVAVGRMRKPGPRAEGRTSDGDPDPDGDRRADPG